MSVLCYSFTYMLSAKELKITNHILRIVVEKIIPKTGEVVAKSTILFCKITAPIKMKVLNFLGVGIAMLGCTTVAAEQGVFFAGLDVLQTNYALKDGYGANMFGKNPAATNIFVGYELPNSFYLELGYESHKSKKKDVYLTPGDTYPGTTITLASFHFDWETYNSKFRIKHPYIGVGYFYNLGCFLNLSFSALAGVSFSEMHAMFTGIQASNVGDVGANIEARNFTKRAVVPVVKIGANYQISDSFSVRATGTWHGMSRFKITPDIANAMIPYEIRLKNGLTAGLGVVYLF